MAGGEMGAGLSEKSRSMKQSQRQRDLNILHYGGLFLKFF